MSDRHALFAGLIPFRPAPPPEPPEAPRPVVIEHVEEIPLWVPLFLIRDEKKRNAQRERLRGRTLAEVLAD